MNKRHKFDKQLMITLDRYDLCALAARWILERVRVSSVQTVHSSLYSNWFQYTRLLSFLPSFPGGCGDTTNYTVFLETEFFYWMKNKYRVNIPLVCWWMNRCAKPTRIIFLLLPRPSSRYLLFNNFRGIGHVRNKWNYYYQPHYFSPKTRSISVPFLTEILRETLEFYYLIRQYRYFLAQQERVFHVSFIFLHKH
jgi:hypothetical protein